MDRAGIEKLLLKDGFTEKEVLSIRQHVEKDGYPYPWLLSHLKKRFIASAIIMLILFAGLIYTIYNGTQQNLVSYSITLVIGYGILYIFTPLKAAYKAYRFMRKHDHLL